MYSSSRYRSATFPGHAGCMNTTGPGTPPAAERRVVVSTADLSPGDHIEAAYQGTVVRRGKVAAITPGPNCSGSPTTSTKVDASWTSPSSTSSVLQARPAENSPRPMTFRGARPCVLREPPAPPSSPSVLRQQSGCFSGTGSEQVRPRSQSRLSWHRRRSRNDDKYHLQQEPGRHRCIIIMQNHAQGNELRMNRK